ncbi:hypothetical protein RUM43_010341 [Polyplax serrata]|uniref:MYND-type domain-containing protein n=1 Tax=Polyplax serrata TaxID=468196 RepID=A0AAN8P3Z4_POLSC
MSNEEDTPSVVSVSEDQREVEKETFEVRKRPSPTSTTMNDILESLLGLPPTSRSPSPGPLSLGSSAAFSPGRSRPFLPLPGGQHQRQSWGDIRANVSESASDPGNAIFTKEMLNRRRKSDGENSAGERGSKRHGEHKSKRHGETSHSGREETTKKEHFSQLADTLVKCRYSKCGKTATIPDAKKTFKTCHNCSHVYCSRECRRAHWERHRRICLHSRVGALCRQVLTTAKDDPKALHHLSMLARRGYLTHGRGAVKIFFSSPELAEKFVARGFDELGEPAYVKWCDLLPVEMGADLFAELMKICKSYNPDTRLVLYVAVCVVSEVPTTGAVKWERQMVSRCCKIGLDKSLVPPKEDKQVPPPLPPRKSSSDCVKITREMENPETLILTSLPGIAGKVPDQKVREISFVNIQRELKQRGVSLRRQFPEVYKKLCSYVEGTSDHFTPVTIYPRDAVSGKTFMCIIMPDSEPEKLELVPKDSTRVQTVDVSVERTSNVEK